MPAHPCWEARKICGNYQLTNLPIYQFLPLENNLPLRFVGVRAFAVFSAGDWIIGEALTVDSFAVRIALLLVAGTISLDRALLPVWITLLLCRRRHRCILPVSQSLRLRLL